jgi:hypothetical protein
LDVQDSCTRDARTAEHKASPGHHQGSPAHSHHQQHDSVAGRVPSTLFDSVTPDCASARHWHDQAAASHRSAQHSTAQHSTAQHSTAQNSKGREHPAQHSTHVAPGSTAQHSSHTSNLLQGQSIINAANQLQRRPTPPPTSRPPPHTPGPRQSQPSQCRRSPLRRVVWHWCAAVTRCSSHACCPQRATRQAPRQPLSQISHTGACACLAAYHPRTTAVAPLLTATPPKASNKAAASCRAYVLTAVDKRNPVCTPCDGTTLSSRRSAAYVFVQHQLCSVRC